MQQGRSFYPVDDAAKADAQGRDYCGPLACPHGRTKTVLRNPQTTRAPRAVRKLRTALRGRGGAGCSGDRRRQGHGGKTRPRPRRGARPADGLVRERGRADRRGERASGGERGRGGRLRGCVGRRRGRDAGRRRARGHQPVRFGDHRRGGGGRSPGPPRGRLWCSGGSARRPRWRRVFGG